jgi:MFS transporter, YNFM family, putative membrane transport protein
MSTRILLLGAAGFIAVGTIRLSDPLLPKIAEEFGTSIGNVALTVTAFTLGYGLFQLLHGPLGDRLGKLRVIAAMLTLASLATVACAWTETIAGLAALRFATGMAAGAVMPLSMAHIGDTVAYDSRQIMIARFLMAALFGQMAAASLAGLLAEHFGWRSAFLVFGATGLVIAACLWPVSLRARGTGVQGGPQITFIALLRHAPARVILGAAFLQGGLAMGALPYAGAYLRQGFGLDYATIGLVLVCFGLGGLIYSFNVRRLIHRLGERGMVVAGGALVVAGYLAMTAASAWQHLMPALALVGLGFFCVQGVLQLRATEIAPQARGTALSGFVFCLFLGQGAGVFILGTAVDGPGYRVMFAATAAAVAVLTAWIQRAVPRSQRTTHLSADERR